MNRVNNIALKSSKEAEYVAKARQAAIVGCQTKAESLAKGLVRTLVRFWQIRYYDQRPCNLSWRYA